MTLLRAGSPRGVFVSLPPPGSWQPRARHLCGGRSSRQENRVQRRASPAGKGPRGRHDHGQERRIAQRRGAEKTQTGDQF